jgi:crotonobetainyl-CoA:carnitine CoA-transferase CaiB-like acyl-CoA transferase
MVLGDLGADVVRVERPASAAAWSATATQPDVADQTLRNRRSVVADLSDPDDVAS